MVPLRIVAVFFFGGGSARGLFRAQGGGAPGWSHGKWILFLYTITIYFTLIKYAAIIEVTVLDKKTNNTAIFSFLLL